MKRFSSYNKIFFLYTYPHCVHYNEKDEFIPINHSNIHYNAIDYIFIQGLYEYTQPNVRYYFHHVHRSFLNTHRTRHEKIYIKLQRFKMAFSRFIHMAKLRYKQTFNSTSLVLHDFQNPPIRICDNNFVYSFEDLELYNMINACFNYEQFSIPTILLLKNPYTNVPFKLYHLVNIYFELLKRGKNSLFLTIYFHSNFCRSIMEKRYEIQLYIHCLERKYNQLEDTQKLNLLFQIFRSFPKYKDFKNVRVSILMDTFHSILKPFYIFKDLNKIGVDEDSSIVEFYENKVRKRLAHVYKRNPIFGRKIFKKTITNNFVSSINEDVLYL